MTVKKMVGHCPKLSAQMDPFSRSHGDSRVSREGGGGAARCGCSPLTSGRNPEFRQIQAKGFMGEFALLERASYSSWLFVQAPSTSNQT